MTQTYRQKLSEYRQQERALLRMLTNEINVWESKQDDPSTRKALLLLYKIAAIINASDITARLDKILGQQEERSGETHHPKPTTPRAFTATTPKPGKRRQSK